MDKDFEKWLKQDELFEYYNANPEHQDDIYKDYQREREYIKPENIDEWLKWLCNNPELAEKHYPLLVNGLKERIQNTQPFQTANIIQNLPEHFTAYKTEINNHVGNYREKRIKEQITLLNSVLNEWQYSNEVVQQAVESVRPYLTEQLEYWKGELRLKVKALFKFIEYLHSNIENFNQYNSLIKELESLKEKRNKLKPEQNYKDKLQYNKVKAELESKFKTLQNNTTNLIKAKARELNVCNFDNESDYSFNGVETEIHELKDNFSNEDLPEIFKHKSQYLEYRSQTHGTFLSLQVFFDELDEITKSLFDYFNKDTEQNEFEAFETKAIQVNSNEEIVKGFKQGQTKFILPNSFLNSSTIQQQPNIEPPPQPTEKPKPEQEAPKTFDELFYNIELVQKSIDVLKEIDPPLIDTDYNYIGKSKGTICLWIDELIRQGIVKHHSDRKIFASLIPLKIKRFSIDESKQRFPK